MEQDTGFEPALSAWKADVLAADTNPAFCLEKIIYLNDGFYTIEI